MSLVSSYKNRNKPLNETQTKYKQNYFNIPNESLHKYVGNPNEIICRSSWETKWCLYCCNNPSILRWSSEPIPIKYINPVKYNNLKNAVGKNGYFDKNEAVMKSVSNYYVDFWIEFLRDDGVVEKIFIEVKPYAQTLEPTKPPMGSKLAVYKRYKKEAETYAVNKAKWLYAEMYARSKGCKFMVVTEKTMKNLKLM